MSIVLEVEDLSKDYLVRDGRRKRVLHAVRDVSFALEPGRTVALVGESGSGKSTIARMLARLATPTTGRILLDGTPVRRGRGAVRRYRSEVQMVFQDPFASLNPAHTIGYHLSRPLRVHGITRGADETRRAVLDLLDQVHLGPAETVAARYPHELSGGQRQRVAIARALAPRPKVLLADEPVSMLDVSIRLEILNLLDELKRDRQLAVLYVTHDLATARHFASEIMVMYRGQIVESGPSDRVILSPAHPYTQLLAEAAPDPRRPKAANDLRALRGDRAATDAGCPFQNRCPKAMPRCATEEPPAVTLDGGQTARCWLYHEQSDAA